MRKNILALATIGMLLLSSLMIIPIVGASGNTIYVDADNTAGPWNGTQEYPFKHIQDAIDSDNTSDGDTIYVYNGTYCENVIVNKSINLVGEDKEITVVDATGGTYALRINNSNVSINGFTIKNATSGYGIEMYKSNNTITDNIIKENGFGLEIGLSSNNVITSNDITDNLAIGIDLCTSATNNIIAENNIICNGEDPFIGYGLVISDSSDNNTIYHNNFVDNNHSVIDDSNNIYDNGYEGNYWDDYNGTDGDGDGIGDTPYNISGGDNQDRYPLMESWPPEEPTEDTTLPVIHSIVPRRALYINGVEKRQRIIRMALIIGDITIEVNATDNESGIKQVNFTIDSLRPFAKQVANDTTAPYTYNWTRGRIRFFHIHVLKVEVIDNAGNIEARTMFVRKIS